MPVFDEKTCAALAKTLAAMCFCNAEIERLHAGVAFVSHTDDHSDVKIIDAEGNEYAWSEVSHISDAEMKILVKDVVNRIYTVLMQCDDPRFERNIRYHRRFTRRWDAPEIDEHLDCTREFMCDDDMFEDE